MESLHANRRAKVRPNRIVTTVAALHHRRASEMARPQAKPRVLCCSVQSSGKRVSAISLVAVSSTGWRPLRIAITISGAR